LRKVVLIDKQKCPICEKSSIGGKTHPGCKGRYTLDGLFSLFKYKGIIRKAITKLKYKKMIDISNELKKLINISFRKYYEEDLLVELEDFVIYDNSIFTPIPLHWFRKMERKFNQAEFLAEIIAQEFQRPLIVDILKRTKHTHRQTELKGKERIDNVKDVFKVKKIYLTEKHKKVKGKWIFKIDKNLRNILLIDDVTTTIATLKSAANTLKRSGAQKVWALTLAS